MPRRREETVIRPSRLQGDLLLLGLRLVEVEGRRCRAVELLWEVTLVVEKRN